MILWSSEQQKGKLHLDALCNSLKLKSWRAPG